jgi:hypothetical protein
VDIREPRSLSLETRIDRSQSVAIAAPRSEHGRRAAERIGEALKGSGVQARCLVDPEPGAMAAADGPTFVVGNLADSRCVRELYVRYLCATDLWYPGPAGSATLSDWVAI